MAIGYTRTPIGKRIAHYRKLNGFKTPLALAEAIPSEKITRSTIVNIEAGRKSDPTVSEIMLIASGLNVSPLVLMLDVESPWAPVEVPGMAAPWAGLSSVEYALLTQITRAENPRGAPSFEYTNLAELLSDIGVAEDLVRDVRRIRDSINLGHTWSVDGYKWTYEGDLPSMPNVQVWGEVPQDKPDRELYEFVVSSYQKVLSHLALYPHFSKAIPSFELTPDVWSRINALGEEVESYLSDLPGLKVPELAWPGDSESLPRLKNPHHVRKLFSSLPRIDKSRRESGGAPTNPAE